MTETKWVTPQTILGFAVFVLWFWIAFCWPSFFATVMVGVSGFAFGGACVLPLARHAIEGWSRALRGWDGE